MPAQSPDDGLALAPRPLQRLNHRPEGFSRQNGRKSLHPLSDRRATAWHPREIGDRNFARTRGQRIGVDEIEFKTLDTVIAHENVFGLGLAFDVLEHCFNSLFQLGDVAPDNVPYLL